MVFSTPEPLGSSPAHEPPYARGGKLQAPDVERRPLVHDVSGSGSKRPARSLTVPKGAVERLIRRFREPQWPSWIDQYFTPAGKAELERAYTELKTVRAVPRATRLSAEDFAAVSYAMFKVQGQADLIRE